MLAPGLYKLDCSIVGEHIDINNPNNNKPRYRLSLDNFFLIERNVDWDINRAGSTETCVVELVNGPHFLKLESLCSDFDFVFRSVRLND